MSMHYLDDDDLAAHENGISLSKEEQEELEYLEYLEEQEAKLQRLSELKRKRERLEELRARRKAKQKTAFDDVQKPDPMDPKQKCVLVVLSIILCLGILYITRAFFFVD